MHMSLPANDCVITYNVLLQSLSFPVSPRFLIDDRVKNFLIIKAGNTIRVDIPFEVSFQT